MINSYIDRCTFANLYSNALSEFSYIIYNNKKRDELNGWRPEICLIQLKNKQRYVTGQRYKTNKPHIEY